MTMLKRQKGAGLIEVLVTVLIMATSLLALGALQSRSLQFNHSAYLRSQANVMAYDILDRMRINAGQYTSYERSLTDAVPGASTNNLAQQDLHEWLTTVGRNLPGGQGSIDCDANRQCTVVLRWVDRDRPAEEGAADPGDEQETTTFTYSTRL